MTYKVLIVDNEPSIRAGLTAGVDWAAMGCEVVGSAADGVEAMELAAKTPPDIVLTDIHMERMDGLELCRVLRARCPGAKCVLITGFKEFDSAYNAIQYENVVNLVLKPTSVFKVSEAIQQAIGQIRDEKRHSELQRQMKNHMQKNLELQQAMLLRSLLEDKAYAAEADKILDEVNISLGEFTVLKLLLNMGSELAQEQRCTIWQMEKEVSAFIARIFAEEEYYVVVSHKKHIHVILNTTPGRPERNPVKLCIDLSNVVDNLTDFYVTAGISEPHQGAQELYRAAVEADAAAGFALYGGAYPIARYRDIPKLSNQQADEIKNQLDQLLGHIVRLDTEHALREFEALSAQWQRQRIPFHAIRNICLLITNACTQQYFVYSGDSHNTLTQPYDYYDRIRRSEQPDQLYAIVLEVLRNTICGLAKKMSQQDDIITNVEQYIYQNYTGELSLELIASAFNISAGHLGRLFKTNKNVNITTYIQNVRMEKARELATQTDLHTYEIAQAVGISDPVYFSKLFKKNTGMRLRDYRMQSKE